MLTWSIRGGRGEEDVNLIQIRPCNYYCDIVIVIITVIAKKSAKFWYS